MPIISASTARSWSALFREEVAGVDRQARLIVPVPLSERSIPGGAVLLLVG